MEILLPFITAMLIDQGLEASNMPIVYRYGILMVVMAFLSFGLWRLGRKICCQCVDRPGSQFTGSDLCQYPDIFLL